MRYIVGKYVSLFLISFLLICQGCSNSSDNTGSTSDVSNSQTTSAPATSTSVNAELAQIKASAVKKGEDTYAEISKIEIDSRREGNEDSQGNFSSHVRGKITVTNTGASPARYKLRVEYLDLYGEEMDEHGLSTRHLLAHASERLRFGSNEPESDDMTIWSYKIFIEGVKDPTEGSIQAAGTPGYGSRADGSAENEKLVASGTVGSY